MSRQIPRSSWNFHPEEGPPGMRRSSAAVTYKSMATGNFVTTGGGSAETSTGPGGGYRPHDSTGSHMRIETAWEAEERRKMELEETGRPSSRTSRYEASTNERETEGSHYGSFAEGDPSGYDARKRSRYEEPYEGSRKSSSRHNSYYEGDRQESSGGHRSSYREYDRYQSDRRQRDSYQYNEPGRERHSQRWSHRGADEHGKSFDQQSRSSFREDRSYSSDRDYRRGAPSRTSNYSGSLDSVGSYDNFVDESNIWVHSNDQSVINREVFVKYKPRDMLLRDFADFVGNKLWERGLCDGSVHPVLKCRKVRNSNNLSVLEFESESFAGAVIEALNGIPSVAGDDSSRKLEFFRHGRYVPSKASLPPSDPKLLETSKQKPDTESTSAEEQDLYNRQIVLRNVPAWMDEVTILDLLRDTLMKLGLCTPRDKSVRGCMKVKPGVFHAEAETVDMASKLLFLNAMKLPKMNLGPAEIPMYVSRHHKNSMQLEKVVFYDAEMPKLIAQKNERIHMRNWGFDRILRVENCGADTDEQEVSRALGDAAQQHNLAINAGNPIEKCSIVSDLAFLYVRSTKETTNMLVLNGFVFGDNVLTISRHEDGPKDDKPVPTWNEFLKNRKHPSPVTAEYGRSDGKTTTDAISPNLKTDERKHNASSINSATTAVTGVGDNTALSNHNDVEKTHDQLEKETETLKQDHDDSSTRFKQSELRNGDLEQAIRKQKEATDGVEISLATEARDVQNVQEENKRFNTQRQADTDDDSDGLNI